MGGERDERAVREWFCKCCTKSVSHFITSLKKHQTHDMGADSIQPGPCSHNPALLRRRQLIKHARTEINVGRLTAHTAIHDSDVNALQLPIPIIRVRDPDLLPAQRIQVRIRRRRCRVVYDVRHRADGVSVRVLEAATTVSWAGRIVC